MGQVSSFTGPPPGDQSASQIAVVSTFKYLGVHVTSQVSTYVQRNLAPLFKQFGQVGKICSKLPLTIIGRANLIKMIRMPQLLYLLHNCHIWLLLKFFKQIDALFRDLIWRYKHPRI